MNAPQIPGWNLALRFGLEVAALAGAGMTAWQVADGPLRWPLTVGAPMVAATVWGTFNVVGDPSRSGKAPVEVPGGVRLLVEAGVLTVGGVGLTLWQPAAGMAYAALVALHYATSTERVGWLLEARTPGGAC